METKNEAVIKQYITSNNKRILILYNQVFVISLSTLDIETTLGQRLVFASNRMMWFRFIIYRPNRLAFCAVDKKCYTNSCQPKYNKK